MMKKILNSLLLAAVALLVLPVHAAGIVNPAFTRTDSGAVAESMQAAIGRAYHVGQFASAADAVKAAKGKRLFVGDGQSVTLDVPSSDFADIQAAVNAIRDWIISANGTVTIQVGGPTCSATYTLSAGVTINHPFGDRLRLVGNETTPANCVLQASGSGFDLITVSNGHTLGYINGFKLSKAAKANWPDNATALLANNGARIITGTKIVVDNWYYAIAARNGSFIYAPSAAASNCGDVCIWAYVGSSLYAPNASATGASDTTNNLGFGFQAEYGSALDCPSCTASGNRIAGIAALSNSIVRSHGATSTGNTGSGFLARDGGAIEAHAGTATSNTLYGVEEIENGRVRGNSMTVSGNTAGQTKNIAYFDNTSLGARIAANGDLRIDNNGTGNTYFNTTGGAQFAVRHTGAAASYFSAYGGAAGSNPVLESTGSASNIDATVRGKGTGSVFLASSGTNFFRFNNAASGSSPILYAEGENNVDLGLAGKGTGTVKFGTFTASGDAAVSGYILIKDLAGNLRKLAVIP